MKIIFPILILCLFLVQCDNKDKSSYTFYNEKNISFNEINYPELLGFTLQIKIADSLLFINQFHEDSLIAVFNTNRNRIEKKIISKGNGPGELMPPLDIQISDNQLYILSRPLFLLNHISMENLLKNDVDFHKDYQMPPKSDCFLPLNDSLFVFSGLWGKRYACLNLASDSIRTFGDFPNYWSEEKDIPDDAKAMFHQCFFGKHPNKNIFVSCSGYILETYQYDDKNEVPQMLRQMQLGKYSYRYVTNGMISTKLKEGSDPSVTELACTEDYIYLVVQSKENRKNRDIMVFDWDCRPVKLLKSNKPILCLTVDEKNNKGYCIIEDPEEKLFYFNL